ncbi:hypothetical protein HDU98_001901 [Podochytrium sp. JEL0797]|nr:hypothetical protein HDU98_001901 [Podochytrium sp. JEL0797]
MPRPRAADTAKTASLNWISNVALRCGAGASTMLQQMRDKFAVTDPDLTFGATELSLKSVCTLASGGMLSSLIIDEFLSYLNAWSLANEKQEDEPGIFFGDSALWHALILAFGVQRRIDTTRDLFLMHPLYDRFEGFFARKGYSFNEFKKLPVPDLITLLLESPCQSYLTVYYSDYHFQLMEWDFTGKSLRINWGQSLGDYTMPDRVRTYLKALFEFHKMPIPVLGEIEGYPRQFDKVSCGLCCLAAILDLWWHGAVYWMAVYPDLFRLNMCRFFLEEVMGKVVSRGDKNSVKAVAVAKREEKELEIALLLSSVPNPDFEMARVLLESMR